MTAPAVMVTGAAGHLGLAVAAAFARSGARLLLIDREADALGAAHAGDGRVVVAAADLLDEAQAGASLQRGIERFGRIDALCHLAGGFRMGEAVHETSARNWDFLFDINARMFLNVARVAVPHLLQQGSGRVVTVGAGAALRGGAHMGAYSAAKSALIRLTESMSAELKDRNINVNCVLPSIIDTPDNRRAMPDADPSAWVAPAALADVIVFLCSEGARALHGASIPVTGRV